MMSDTSRTTRGKPTFGRFGCFDGQMKPIDDTLRHCVRRVYFGIPFSRSKLFRFLRQPTVISRDAKASASPTAKQFIQRERHQRSTERQPSRFSNSDTQCSKVSSPNLPSGVPCRMIYEMVLCRATWPNQESFRMLYI